MILNLKALIARLFYVPQWNIGTAHGSLDTVLEMGQLPSITWWRRESPAIFQADPFFYGGNVLYERMNRWRGKAEIWLAQADGTHRRRYIQKPGHVSYPCVVNLDGRTLLLVESASVGECQLLERRNQGWVQVSRIRQPIVDATLVRHGERYWIFGGLDGETANRELHIWWAESLDGPWRPHGANPVKRDASCSRPAGGFCQSTIGLIRPAQDCSSTYGGGIALCRVQRLDEHRFEEDVVLRLAPDGQYPSGMHTINSQGNRIVVDGKRHVFHPFAFLLKRTSRLQSLIAQHAVAR